MKQHLQHLGVIAIITAMAASLALGSGFQLNEHGARAMALGGAFTARASDLSALYFNPAGLAYMKGGHATLGTTLIMPRSSFYGPTQLNTNTETKMVNQLFTPINVGVSYELADGLVAAIGVNNPYGLGTEWPEDWAGKFISTKIDLMTFFISPTIAYQVTEDLSVGVGLNYVIGNVDINRVVSDPFDPHAKVKISASDDGMGFNVGAMYKFSPAFSIGAAYRSEVKIEATGTAEFTPNRSIYPGGDMSAALTLPANAFVGIAVTPMEDLTLSADYQFVGWSSYKELKIEFKKDNSTSVSPKDYEDSYVIRLGAEYTMNDLQLRAGYLYDKSPVKDKYVEPLLPDASRNGFNVGFGYKLSENISVDFGYFFLKMDQRKAIGTEVNFDGTYNQYAHLIGFNLNYTF
ncbi:MAG: porin [bacterium]